MVQVQQKSRHHATAMDREFLSFKSSRSYDFTGFYETVASDDDCNMAAEVEVIDEDACRPLLESTVSNANDDLFHTFYCPLTPPLSPVRTHGEATFGDGSSGHAYDHDRLQIAFDQLDGSDEEALPHAPPCGPFAGHLQSKLISDCMWSGQRERKYSTAIDMDFSWKVTPVEDTLYPTPCPTPPPVLCAPNAADLSDHFLASVVCPAAVFPTLPRCVVDSGAGFSSGLSDTDEEIDVVTVDSRKPGRAAARVSGRCTSLLETAPAPGVAERSPCKRKLVAPDSTSTTKTVVKPTMVGIPLIASDGPRAAQSCSSLRRTKSSPAKVCRLKSGKTTAKSAPAFGGVIRSQASVACCVADLSDFPVVTDGAAVADADPDADVDAKPEEKRVCHNTLERRRRVNLKLSFDKLREAVPSFKPSEKVAKVVILQKATSHIDSLQREEVELEREKRRLERRRELLLDRLRTLSSSQVKCVPQM